MSAVRKPSLIGAAFVGLTGLSRCLRPWLWGWWYDRLATSDPDGMLSLMNYGYADDEAAPSFPARREDEPFHAALRLYANTVQGIELGGKDLLEIGCGRGGGGAFLIRTYHPRRFIGVDLSHQAISWCREKHRFPNACWEWGHADALPVADASVDVAINVESSHCYPSMPAFLAEVRRIVRPGGFFAFCDFRATGELEELECAFEQSGLEPIRYRVITSQVLRALTRMSEERERLIAARAPWFLRSAFRDFAAVKNSVLYDKFANGELTYVHGIFQRA
jgi:ubiquinone/menaquinone biosynthesis C-methylase UbiE